MRTADINMLMIIQMYIKRERYIQRAMLIYFFNIDFQRSKGGSIFSENKIKTSNMFRPESIE